MPICTHYSTRGPGKRFERTWKRTASRYLSELTPGAVFEDPCFAEGDRHRVSICLPEWYHCCQLGEPISYNQQEPLPPLRQWEGAYYVHTDGLEGFLCREELQMVCVLPQLYPIASAGGTVADRRGHVRCHVRPVVDPSDVVLHPVQLGVPMQ